MTATFSDIKGWFDKGKKEGKRTMLVMRDNFDYVKYPVFLDEGAEVEQEIAKRNSNMQQVEEVYDLHKDRGFQLNQPIAWNIPRP